MDAILNIRDNIYYDAVPNNDPDDPTWIIGDAADLFRAAVGGNDTIFGLAHDDMIQGDAVGMRHSIGGDDRLYGGAGEDTIAGDGHNMDDSTGGDDVVVQNGGRGFLYGDASYDLRNGSHGGDDLLRGGEVLRGDALFLIDSFGGDDVLDASHIRSVKVAGGHPDWIPYLEGDGQLIGASVGGQDMLLGSRFDDILYGEGAYLQDTSHGKSDVIAGGSGDDTIAGEAYEMLDRSVGGDDVLRGGSGNDVIYGDAAFLRSGNIDCGDDVIRGGHGDDELWGDGQGVTTGGGDDTFRFSSRFGNDVIEDFGFGDDRLVFEGCKDDPGYEIDYEGADTIITIHGGGSVTLSGYGDGLVEGDNLLFV